MDRTSELDGSRQESRLERFLTPLAIGIFLLGLGLIVAGPVRSLVTGAAAGLTGNDGPISAAQVLAGVAGAEIAAIDPESRSLIQKKIVPFTTVPDRPRDEVIVHEVAPGDTLFGLADAFGLSPNTIFWANTDRLRSVHSLERGLELFILPVDGVYHRSYEELTISQIATKYQVEPQVIIESEYNQLIESSPETVPPWGMRIVVEGGTGEFVDLSPIVDTVDEATGQIVRSFMPGMGGSCAPGIAGSGGSGAWAVPIAPGSYAFTQPFYPGHSGIDLAASIGTSVLAADSGVVIFSGWVDASWGYGVLIVLDHGNGWTSYYAHLSSAGVGCGAFVSKGGFIGSVGTTGNSSGPHLHFELRFNHTAVDPVGYMGF